MCKIKKIIFLILSVTAAMLLQITVSAYETSEYIVKLKSEVQLFAYDSEKMLKPFIPKLGLYTAEDISGLNADMFEFIEEDAAVELFDTYDYSSIMTRRYYAITGIKSMWDTGIYGKGVRVGVIDSGCDPHQALADNLCEGASFVDESEDTYDHIGHGTSVCGVVAAQYGCGHAIGTAHKTSIVPLKFIDYDEQGDVVGGTVKRLANAIIAAADDFDCDIINMSCGTIHSHTLETAVDYAVSNGVVVVASVGNSGSEEYCYPAAYDNVIGVGSVNDIKEHSHFSNTNDSVFVTAPGENMELLSGTDSITKNSGTSFSAPYVSGIIADMCEIDPDITVQAVMDIISETAEDLGDEGYDNVFGYGLIRADSIIDHMLRKYECFVSEIDICPVDSFSEVRFRFNNTEYPQGILAEYVDGVLSQVDLDMKYIDNNIFVLRLKQTGSGSLRSFAWDSVEGMKPMKINECGH